MIKNIQKSNMKVIIIYVHLEYFVEIIVDI